MQRPVIVGAGEFVDIFISNWDKEGDNETYMLNSKNGKFVGSDGSVFVLSDFHSNIFAVVYYL